jgi:hypothetical protein
VVSNFENSGPRTVRDTPRRSPSCPISRFPARVHWCGVRAALQLCSVAKICYLLTTAPIGGYPATPTCCHTFLSTNIHKCFRLCLFGFCDVFTNIWYVIRDTRQNILTANLTQILLTSLCSFSALPALSATLQIHFSLNMFPVHCLYILPIEILSGFAYAFTISNSPCYFILI